MAEQSRRGTPAWYDEPGTAFLPKQQTPAEGGETARHIAEIEERLRNVTPGPWSSYDENGCSDDEPCWWVSGPAMVDAGESAYFTEADATFIAAAPTDIARLLAIVRRQRELLAECAVPLLDCSTQCPRLMKADTDLTALRGQVERMRVALEDARHELTIVHGLSASDRVSAYGHAQEMGADANGAWGAFCETLFTIDTSAELAIIDAALAASDTGGEDVTDAQLKAWQRHVLYARRRVEQFQVAGNPTGVPEDAAILAADKIVQAAREYVRAAEYAYAVSATRHPDAEVIRATSADADTYAALVAALGEVHVSH